MLLSWCCWWQAAERRVVHAVRATGAGTFDMMNERPGGPRRTSHAQVTVKAMMPPMTTRPIMAHMAE